MKMLQKTLATDSGGLESVTIVFSRLHQHTSVKAATSRIQKDIKTQYIFVMMEETTSKDKKQCIMYFLCQAVNKVFIASKLAILL